MKKPPNLFLMVGAAIILMIVLFVIAIIGVGGGDGCLYRYNIKEKGKEKEFVSRSMITTNNLTLRADGNYKATSNDKEDNNVDPNDYGQWVNTNLRVTADKKIKMKITGEVSLCLAQLPNNNLQSDSNKDQNGEIISIPRVDDISARPVTIYLDAKKDSWGNVVKLSPNDQILVSIVPDQQSANTVMYNSIVAGDITADCRENQTSYSDESRVGANSNNKRICGKYSIWGNGDRYVSGCEGVYYWNNKPHCGQYDPGGLYAMTNYYCVYFNKIFSESPKPYQNDGKYTYQFLDEALILNLTVPSDITCPEVTDEENGERKWRWQHSEKEKLCPLIRDYTDYRGEEVPEVCGDLGEYVAAKNVAIDQPDAKFWFSADDASGLLYRFKGDGKTDGDEYDGVAKIQKDKVFQLIGPDGKSIAEFASDDDIDPGLLDIKENEDDENSEQKYKKEYYKILLNQNDTTTTPRYLQYRLLNKRLVGADNAADSEANTGGYVFNIKQTACRGTNGQLIGSDNLGRVQYIVSDVRPKPDSKSDGNIENSKEFKIPSGSSGSLWLRINNKSDNYKDSVGQYNVEFSSEQKYNNFQDHILNPLFDGLKTRVKESSIKIFKNMTCYDGNKENCTNFFHYINTMLTIYIVLYGMMFLIGMVQISQTDIIIRVIKISLVAGLMNGSTYEFFNDYVFNLVTGFSDDIISNIAGYSSSSDNATVSNPFMFLDEVLTKIFFSPTFIAQIMALLSMGLNGALCFILIFVCLVIVVIVAFRAIAVYLMAFMAIAVLIGLAPLFLTFMLFNQTWYLFDNWVKFMFRYMIEPVVMLVGIIILTQLFTIYLDYVIGYSVCWKCAIPIKFPFISLLKSLPGMPVDFLGESFFCFNWFTPWGFDHRSSEMGVNMQYMIGLLMLAYAMWGYIDFSNKIVARLAGSSGGPSATMMGNKMSGAASEGVLAKFGLDEKSRKEIKGNMEAAKKKKKREAIKEAGKVSKSGRSLGGNRHNIAKTPSTSAGTPSTSAGTPSTSAGTPSTSAKASKTSAKASKTSVSRSNSQSLDDSTKQNKTGSRYDNLAEQKAQRAEIDNSINQPNDSISDSKVAEEKAENIPTNKSGNSNVDNGRTKNAQNNKIGDDNTEKSKNHNEDGKKIPSDKTHAKKLSNNQDKSNAQDADKSLKNNKVQDSKVQDSKVQDSKVQDKKAQRSSIEDFSDSKKNDDE